jgi:LmbE family N-acetylglucosaminyl deacetylase
MGEDRRRVMAVFAHPDDEGQVAGIMAKLSSGGAEVFLVCATRGEMGTVNDPSLLVGKSIAQLREEELRCACAVLGVKKLRFLNYREDAFRAANPDGAIDKLMKTIRDLKPHVVITFGPEGVYGHPDHIAIGRLVTSAFHAARESGIAQGLYFPTKLYYTAYPKGVFDGLRSEGIEFRLEIDGAMHRVDGVPDEKITTVIDVGDFQSQKIAAFRCHRSQIRPGDLRWMIMTGRSRGLLVTERLVRVFPPLERSGPIEQDLCN